MGDQVREIDREGQPRDVEPGQMAVSVLSDDGNIAIPPAIREALGVQAGDELVLVVEPERAGAATLRRRSAAEQLAAAVAARGRPLTIEEMHEAWPAAAIERDQRVLNDLRSRG